MVKCCVRGFHYAKIALSTTNVGKNLENRTVDAGRRGLLRVPDPTEGSKGINGVYDHKSFLGSRSIEDGREGRRRAIEEDQIRLKKEGYHGEKQEERATPAAALKTKKKSSSVVGSVFIGDVDTKCGCGWKQLSQPQPLYQTDC